MQTFWAILCFFLSLNQMLTWNLNLGFWQIRCVYLNWIWVGCLIGWLAFVDRLLHTLEVKKAIDYAYFPNCSFLEKSWVNMHAKFWAIFQLSFLFCSCSSLIRLMLMNTGHWWIMFTMALFIYHNFKSFPLSRCCHFFFNL